MSFSHEAVWAASQRIKGLVHVTPVFTSQSLDKIAGRNLFFKAENLQKTGSFKARGATNAVKVLLEQNPNLPGVVTHSSGNHGQALSFAARELGVKCSVASPKNAPLVKLDAMRSYGSDLILCEPTMTARIETCRELSQELGYVEVDPHNDPLVMAGQGSIGVEFLEQVPELDAILVPIGGGGMISGIAAWVKHAKPDCQVYAVEPKGKDLGPCLEAGKRLWPDPPGMVDTIADGIRVQRVGTNCFPVILQHVSKTVFTVTNEEIKYGMEMAFQRLKQVIEPSSGTGVAAALGPQLKSLDPSIKNVGVILCGGNVDLNNLPWL